MESSIMNFISEDSIFKDNVFGNNIKIYRNSEVRNCHLGDLITVGDSSIVLDCNLLSNISINRRNYLLRSEVGRFTYTGINTMIRSSEVGSFCSISWNVSIGGGDHPQKQIATSKLSRFYQLDSGMWDKKSKKELEETFLNMEQCNIGNDVLISSNVTILRNVKIGNGAIIGAGAVVTKDVEPYSIVAGVPAKKIKMRFDDKTIEALESIKWWNWPIDTIRQNLDLIYLKKVDSEVIEKLKDINYNLRP